MRSPLFLKGDLALSKVITDLIQKQYQILLPFSEQSPFDLIAYNEKDNKFLKIQVKYSGGEQSKELKNQSSYNENAFDYYAMYIPEFDKVIYPHISLKGKHISTQRIYNVSFYWWEDFLEIIDKDNIPSKKTANDFDWEKPIYPDKLDKRKVIRPSKEELFKLLWEKSSVKIAKQYGVSDATIVKWAKRYGIAKPKPGYWNKVYANKIETE